jgi:hypothetical protein
MSKVPDVELTDIEEIVAAAEVETQAAKLIHDWQIDQLGKITTEIVPNYISKFELEIKRQPNGKTMAEKFVNEEMITFIASVMAEIAFRPIDEKNRILSRMIGALNRKNLQIKETYEVMSSADQVGADIDTFFNTEKINMATPLLTELEKLSPPKQKKKDDDGCVVSGGSKRRKSKKSKKSMNKRNKRNSMKSRIIRRRTRKSRV